MFKSLFADKSAPIETLREVHALNESDRATVKAIAQRGSGATLALQEVTVALSSNPSPETAQASFDASMNVRHAATWTEAFQIAKPAFVKRKVDRSIEPCREGITWLVNELADKIAKVREADLQLRADLDLGPEKSPEPVNDKSSAPPPQPQQSGALTALLHRPEKADRLRRRLHEDWTPNDIPGCPVSIDAVIEFCLECI